MMDISTYGIVYLKVLIASGLCFLAFLSFKFRTTLEQLFSNLGKLKSFLLISVLFRIIPFVIIYIVLHLKAQSDVYIFWKSAQEASKFKLVYRDFESLYSPFFPYITALLLYIWDTAEAVTLTMVLVELLTLWLTLNTFSSKNQASDLFKALIYLLLPAPFVFCIIGGQEDIWMWGFACLMIYCWQRKKSDLILGIITGLGLLTTKAFFVLFIPLVFLKVNNKIKFIIGNFIVGLPVLIFLFYYGGTSFLMPIRLAQEPMAPNFWSIANPFIWSLNLTNNIKLLNWLGLFVILSFALWQTYLSKNLNIQQFVPKIWIVIFGLMMMIQVGSYANYIFIYAMPLLFGFDFFKDKKFLIITFFIQFVAAFQPSLWFRTGKPFLQFKDFAETRFTLEYAFEIIIFVGVLYWLNLVIRKERSLDSFK